MPTSRRDEHKQGSLECITYTYLRYAYVTTMIKSIFLWTTDINDITLLLEEYNSLYIQSWNAVFPHVHWMFRQ